MLRFEEARARLLALAAPLGRERVALDDADGRVLAEDVIAPADSPEDDTSAMDGYAVRAADVASAPVELLVRGEARPGGPEVTFEIGTACRIFTGARLPHGADAVVLQEDVAREGERARFAKSVRAGANVRKRGEDVAAGARGLTRGTRLGPAQIGLLATMDRAWVEVARRPRVVVLGTGDELRLPGSTPRPGTVAESGTIAVRAMARRAGADAILAPMVRDDAESTAVALGDAIRASDLVVTIGGMSEGDYDLVRPVWAKLGVSLEFWKVAIKPGKPLGVGVHPHGHVLGLPGNPAAAVVTFALFGVPFLRALQGDAAPVARSSRVPLAALVSHKPGRRSFLRARFEDESGELRVRALAHQSSASMASVAHADALIVLPEDVAELAAGVPVETWRLADVGA